VKRLNRIVAKGVSSRRRGNWIRCRDGFQMSVIARWGTYCRPKIAFCMDPLSWKRGPCGKCREDGYSEVPCDYRGPFTHVEVGFPSLRPEPWEDWAPYTDEDEEIFAYVPVELVRRLIIKHRGERRNQR
jgi:hypothetical protein